MNKKEREEYFLLCDQILKDKKLNAEQNNRFIILNFKDKK